MMNPEQLDLSPGPWEIEWDTWCARRCIDRLAYEVRPTVAHDAVTPLYNTQSFLDRDKLNARWENYVEPRLQRPVDETDITVVI